MSEPSIRQPNASTWEWRVGARGYSARLFASTGRIIWSSWAETGDVPQFDDGFAQSIERFRAGEPPPFPVPDAVRQALLDATA